MICLSIITLLLGAVSSDHDPKNYRIMVWTGDKEYAGTDADVQIKLYGDDGETSFITLDTKGDNFERGQVDLFDIAVSGDYIGRLRKITIKHDNSNLRPGWYLEKVAIFDPTKRSFIFFCGRWLDEDQDDGRIERTILAKKTETCGVKHPFILDDTLLGEKTFSIKAHSPWHVLFKYDGGYHCGGVLVHKQWILTSASCVGSTTGIHHYSVVLGAGLKKRLFQDFLVDSIVLHPNFNNKTGENDLALVKLYSEALLNGYVNTICLTDSHYTLKSGFECQTSGWTTIADGAGESMVYGKVTTELNSICQNNSSSMTKHFDKDSEVCGKHHSSDSCVKGTGNPLVCRSMDGRYYLQGLQTGRRISCTRDHISYFTRLPKYQTWIEQTIYTN